MPDETLLDVVKRELKARGYEEVEPNPAGGGVWTHPSWSGASDKIIEAIRDAFTEGR
jgi:hypothetical protein